MSQHDFDITVSDANTGTTMRAAINAALQALASNNLGTTAPVTTYAGMWWVDTTTGKLWQRDAANAAWIDKGLISATDDSAWTAATLQSNWVTHTAGQELSYKKTASGEVFVTGMIKNGTKLSGTAITTLPVGYRPGRVVYGLIYDSLAFRTGYSNIAVQVSTLGVVSLMSDISGNARVAFSLSFLAEG